MLPAIERLDNGKRIYQESDLFRIWMVMCMREAGMSVDSIKKFNELDLRGEETLPEKRQIIIGQKAQIENKIRELQGLLELLNMKLEHYNERITKMKST